MAEAERVVFAVRGLGCASCAVDVGRQLGRLPGVRDININYVVDRGYVEFDPAVTNWETLAKALQARGYTAFRTR